jgi:3',5'-cyclic AMP phosphodiesterase CpdA
VVIAIALTFLRLVLPMLEPPPLRIVVLSDINSRYGSTTYQDSVHGAVDAVVHDIHPDLVLVTGDMVAGQTHKADHPAMWRAFHAAVTAPIVAAGIPIAPTPGNHDAAPNFERERREYTMQWSTPQTRARVGYVEDSHYPLRYSFEQNGVFFVALDAAAVGPLSSEQLDWLADQLEHSDARVKIVFGHLPNHPFARGRERETLADRRLDALLVQHHVTAYISGHHHAYFPGTLDGVRHVAMPCLGAGPRRLIGENAHSPTALLVIDIDADGIARLEAVRAPDYHTTVPRTSLPRRIGAVLRDDLITIPARRGS